MLARNREIDEAAYWARRFELQKNKIQLPYDVVKRLRNEKIPIKRMVSRCEDPEKCHKDDVNRIWINNNKSFTDMLIDLKNQKNLGIDCEDGPFEGVLGLIQIATIKKNVYLIDTTDNANISSENWDLLGKIFNDRTILKIGNYSHVY